MSLVLLATPASGSPPLEVKADRIDYLQDQDIYEAEGSVVVDQGSVHLTADHLIVQALLAS